MTLLKTCGALAAALLMSSSLSAAETPAAPAATPTAPAAVQQVGWFTATQKPQVRCYRAPSRGNAPSRSYGKSYGAHKPSSKPAWALQKTHPQKYSTRR